MGYDLSNFTAAQIAMMHPDDRKAFGKRAMTNAEIRDKQVTTLERKIHFQFLSFCSRHGIIVWHSNPTRKSSIRSGLPDFLCLRNNIAVLIEFKIAPNTTTPMQNDVFNEIVQCGNAPVRICIEANEGSAYKYATDILRKAYGFDGD